MVIVVHIMRLATLYPVLSYNYQAVDCRDVYQQQCAVIPDEAKVLPVQPKKGMPTPDKTNKNAQTTKAKGGSK